MRKCKFKVGDKVRRTTESLIPEKYGIKGEVYTVSGIEKSPIVHSLIVRLSLVELSECWHSPYRFELVERSNLLPDNLFIL